MELVFQAESALITYRLGRELHILFKSKLMNTCDYEVTTSSRDGNMGLATLTTGGTSAIVARKSQMRPWPTVNVSADGKHHDL